MLALFNLKGSDGGVAAGNGQGDGPPAAAGGRGFAALFAAANGRALPPTGKGLPPAVLPAEALPSAVPGEATTTAASATPLAPPAPDAPGSTAESLPGGSSPSPVTADGGGPAGAHAAEVALATRAEARAAADLAMPVDARAAEADAAAPAAPEDEIVAPVLAPETVRRALSADAAAGRAPGGHVDGPEGLERRGAVSGQPTPTVLAEAVRASLEPRAPAAVAPAAGGERAVLDAVRSPAPTPAAPAPSADALLVDAAAEAASRPPAPPAFAVAPGVSAGAATSAPAPAPVPAAIDVPVADPDWGGALGDRVLWMAGQKIQSAEVRMNPAELGPLTVSVKVEDGTAQVTFTAQHAVTRDAIEQALPRLREMFAAEGMTLANANVGEQGVRQGTDGHPGSDGGVVAGADGADGDLAADADAGAAGSRRPHDGLVDLFA